MPDMTDPTLAAIKSRHVPGGKARGPLSRRCASCHQVYPCDVVTLAEGYQVRLRWLEEGKHLTKLHLEFLDKRHADPIGTLSQLGAIVQRQKDWLAHEPQASATPPGGEAE